MEQYWSIKTAHTDKLLFFRMGDFYEMFYEDAETAAPLLGITLTARNKKSGDKTPMCGMPHHSVGGHINKLLSLGHKVALCDQVEDPKQAKGLVRREVTRILSPGMVYDPDGLAKDRPNYLAAYDSHVLAFLEPTTGECFYYPVAGTSQTETLLRALLPVEIVLAPEQKPLGPETSLLSTHGDVAEGGEPLAARRLLSYGKSMQGESLLAVLSPFEERDSEFRMQFGANVFSHLEVFKTYRGETTGSLFWAVDRTKTAGGARLLRQWMLFPLGDRKKIEKRQEQVARWTQSLEPLRALRKELSGIGDLQRKLGKVSQPHCHPRDLQGLAEAFRQCLKVLPMTELQDTVVWEEIQDLQLEIDRTFVDEIPNNYRDGAFVAHGVFPALDGFIELAQGSQQKVQALEAREREATGIASLKVRYNNVFGFYIEVTNTHKAKVPKERYMRKQTLTNAERDVTDELNVLEKKVLSARTQRNALELQIFADLKSKVLRKAGTVLRVAQAVNGLDVVGALAWLALENNYVRPKVVEKGVLTLRGSRHPVIEQCVADSFVENDIEIGPQQSLLITGPNMAGKSTLMRQVAVSCILSQMGSFVPAREAQLPLVDRIYTRIGASDFLTEGLSTFMVEMQETAEMLSGASERSLVILDEVGRGTSTYDGMSLAQAILEHFVSDDGPRALFATHYHELTALEETFPGRVLNRHMALKEGRKGFEFSYQLRPGPAGKSYGIQVAALAGLPKAVVDRARHLLGRLEGQATSTDSSVAKGEEAFAGGSRPGAPDPGQMDFFTTVVGAPAPPPAFGETLQDLRDIDIQKMTPLDALNKISEWQKDLSSTFDI